ncbi:MAG TPA: chemotaxis protein CheW [Pyrinomonadaceae bacterium]|jgi:chemotaxis signal transduction protein
MAGSNNEQKSSEYSAPVAERRTLRLIKTGSLLFGVFETEVATTATWRTPTPLPDAPPAILGVVSIEGRMLTVLDTLKLLGESNKTTPRQILSLRGEEQLALAIDEAPETIEVNAEEMERSGQSEAIALAGTVNHQGAKVLVLDTERLFVAAFEGRERRRRRS